MILLTTVYYQSPQSPMGGDLSTPNLIASCSSTHSWHSSHTSLLSVLQINQTHFCFKAIAHVFLFYCNALTVAYFAVLILHVSSYLPFSQRNSPNHLIYRTLSSVFFLNTSSFKLSCICLVIVCLLPLNHNPFEVNSLVQGQYKH